MEYSSEHLVEIIIKSTMIPDKLSYFHVDYRIMQAMHFLQKCKYTQVLMGTVCKTLLSTIEKSQIKFP